MMNQRFDSNSHTHAQTHTLARLISIGGRSVQWRIAGLSNRRRAACVDNMSQRGQQLVRRCRGNCDYCLIFILLVLLFYYSFVYFVLRFIHSTNSVSLVSFYFSSSFCFFFFVSVLQRRSANMSDRCAASCRRRLSLGAR